MSDLDLLDEVQEDLKEEQYGRAVKLITRAFLIVALLALIFTAGYAWKKNSDAKLENELSIAFASAISLIEQNQLNEALVYLDKVIAHSSQQYAALAYLQKSSILMKQNKPEEAQKVLLEMSKNSNFDSAFGDLALIIFLGNQLQLSKEVDKQSIDMLKDLTKDGKPWQLSALQLKALYDLKQNKIEDAKITLNDIINSKDSSKYSQDTASSILSVISRSK